MYKTASFFCIIKFFNQFKAAYLIHIPLNSFLGKRLIINYHLIIHHTSSSISFTKKYVSFFQSAIHTYRGKEVLLFFLQLILKNQVQHIPIPILLYYCSTFYGCYNNIFLREQTRPYRLKNLQGTISRKALHCGYSHQPRDEFLQKPDESLLHNKIVLQC